MYLHKLNLISKVYYKQYQLLIFKRFTIDILTIIVLSIATMKSYTVLYRDETLSAAAAPLAFVCQADDCDHAEEQCINAEPDCIIVWMVEDCDNAAAALKDYYDSDNWDFGKESNMTYADLLANLQKMSAEDLKKNVTVYVRGVDEYYPVQNNIKLTEETDVLDEQHPYLVV